MLDEGKDGVTLAVSCNQQIVALGSVCPLGILFHADDLLQHYADNTRSRADHKVVKERDGT